MKRSGYVFIGLVTLIVSGLAILKDKLFPQPEVIENVQGELYGDIKDDTYSSGTREQPYPGFVIPFYQFPLKVFCFSCSQYHEIGKPCDRSPLI